jgi:hypothetical protein
MGLWVMGIGLLSSVGGGSVEFAYAGEKEHAMTCTLDTLKGQYLVAASGTLFPPAFGIPAGTPPSVSNAAGYSVIMETVRVKTG